MTDKILDSSVFGNERGDTTPSVARFTPGPWFVTGDSGYESINDSWREGLTIGSVPEGSRICDLTPLRNRDGNAANARLIAAAPDLYVALKNARRRLAHIAATCGLPNAIEACRLNVREAQVAGHDIDAALLKAVPQTVAPGDTQNTDSSPNTTDTPA